MVEVVTAVAEAVGAGRVGLRISPEHDIQGALETDRDDVLATYGTLLDQPGPARPGLPVGAAPRADR
ncbi:hypothetical protein GCM10025868_26660 [Angustibacter aerolatus]|uniref:Uncharacterized protein n=1 Tax=Angustibacter aerolatus TaxID=1162965 RepID=A0ABQ6JGQ7_9ACTN|nr:hypothetical protein GCM10025868_26660 [Angustibacter aerolatus]